MRFYIFIDLFCLGRGAVCHSFHKLHFPGGVCWMSPLFSVSGRKGCSELGGFFIFGCFCWYHNLSLEPYLTSFSCQIPPYTFNWIFFMQIKGWLTLSLPPLNPHAQKLRVLFLVKGPLLLPPSFPPSFSLLQLLEIQILSPGSPVLPN